MTPLSVTLCRRISTVRQFTPTVNGTSSNTSGTWSLEPRHRDDTGSRPLHRSSFDHRSQTVTMTATSVADPTKSATATVTLNPARVVYDQPRQRYFDCQSQIQSSRPRLASTSNTAVTWTLKSVHRHDIGHGSLHRASH